MLISRRSVLPPQLIHIEYDILKVKTQFMFQQHLALSPFGTSFNGLGFSYYWIKFNFSMTTVLYRKRIESTLSVLTGMILNFMDLSYYFS